MSCEICAHPKPMSTGVCEGCLNWLLKIFGDSAEKNP